MILLKGLTIYLNSTIVDNFIRISNGHTQINAMDLRILKYPFKKDLQEIGKIYQKIFPSQEEIDKIIKIILRT